MATAGCGRRCSSRVWSEEARKVFKIVKDAFDPAGILNPGVKIPLAGQPRDRAT